MTTTFQRARAVGMDVGRETLRLFGHVGTRTQEEDARLRVRVHEVIREKRKYREWRAEQRRRDEARPRPSGQFTEFVARRQAARLNDRRESGARAARRGNEHGTGDHQGP